MHETEPKNWQSFELERVAQSAFQINVLEVELLAERLIRKHILTQFVTPSHPVFLKELQLVRDSHSSVDDHIQDLVNRGYAERLVRMAVAKRIIDSIRVIIGLHDIDEDCAEVAVHGAEREAMLIASKTPVDS